jgi:hypothetical protein
MKTNRVKGKRPPLVGFWWQWAVTSTAEPQLTLSHNHTTPVSFLHVQWVSVQS